MELRRLALVLVTLSLAACAPALSPPAAAGSSSSSTSSVPAIYIVGGQVTGLRGIGLTLRDARGEEVKVREDGSFVFGTPLADHTPFAVTVGREPISPVQSCSVDHGAGKIAGRDAMEITIRCATMSFDDEVPHREAPAVVASTEPRDRVSYRP